MLEHAPADADRVAADAAAIATERERASAAAALAREDDEVLAAARERDDTTEAVRPAAVTEDYTVYRTGEAPDPSPAAEATRTESGMHFSTSTADKQRVGGRSEPDRVVRGPSTPSAPTTSAAESCKRRATLGHSVSSVSRLRCA